MERLDGVLLLTALLLAGLNSAEAGVIPSYFKHGDKLVLRPPPVSGPITTLVWKHNGDLLGEWFGSSEPDYYRTFRGRTTMNTKTGVLEISNFTEADNGDYSVAINNQDQANLYRILQIEDVPEPEVFVRPLTCSLSSISCTLSCDGNIKKAGPVDFFWRRDVGEWEKSEKDLVINKEDSGVKNFICRMKNPFSNKESKPKPNPLYQLPTQPPGSGPGAVAAAVIIPLLVLVVVVGGGGTFLWKKGLIQQWTNRTPKEPQVSLTSTNVPKETTEEPRGFSTSINVPKETTEEPRGFSTSINGPKETPEELRGSSTYINVPKETTEEPRGFSTSINGPKETTEEPRGFSTSINGPKETPEELRGSSTSINGPKETTEEPLGSSTSINGLKETTEEPLGSLTSTDGPKETTPMMMTNEELPEGNP